MQSNCFGSQPNGPYGWAKFTAVQYRSPHRTLLLANTDAKEQLNMLVARYYPLKLLTSSKWGKVDVHSIYIPLYAMNVHHSMAHLFNAFILFRT